MDIMKKILVPVDFSEHSEYALHVAAIIAKQHNAGIVLLHMIGMSDSVLANSEIAEEAEAKYYLNLAKDKIKQYTEKEYLKGISLEAIIQNYKDFEEVNNVAEEKNCDLVVMGSHGTSGISELFVGSNTEKVVRTSNVPVIVIKKPHQDFTIKKMVMATDFANKSVSAYIKADTFAKLFNASLEVVYVNTTGANFIGYDIVDKRLEAFKKELGKDVNINFYSSPSVERGILKYCQEKNADLLVIPTHGRKGLAHFVVGSLAENVSNHAQMPVMTIKM
jgi:nucleotide-binding universal stress UspA family protein